MARDTTENSSARNKIARQAGQRSLRRHPACSWSRLHALRFDSDVLSSWLSLLFDDLQERESLSAQYARMRTCDGHKLHTRGICEFRIGLGLRILLQLTADQINFRCLGTHDDVRKSLKNL